MTLIEHIYQTLKQAQLTTTREAFSRDYVGKCSNWFAWQRHKQRDFSIQSAIQCLRSIRAQKQRDPALDMVQRLALTTAERRLIEHLNEHHGVAEICA